MLSLAVAAPGDFSTYTLTIRSTALDPYFDAVAVQLQGELPERPRLRGTRSGAARRRTASRCRSTTSPRTSRASSQALSDFSSLRYPLWVERSEADVGVMLMEALSAVADELSYLQDRVAAEATLGTATQRVSLVRHARLVDYEPSPAIAATTTLQLDVAAGVTSIEPDCAAARSAPTACSSLRGRRAARRSRDRRARRRDLPGRRAVEPPPRAASCRTGGTTAAQCLPAGSTRLWLIGQGYGFAPNAPAAADRHRRPDDSRSADPRDRHDRNGRARRAIRCSARR